MRARERTDNYTFTHSFVALSVLYPKMRVHLKHIRERDDGNRCFSLFCILTRWVLSRKCRSIDGVRYHKFGGIMLHVFFWWRINKSRLDLFAWKTYFVQYYYRRLVLLMISSKSHVNFVLMRNHEITMVFVVLEIFHLQFFFFKEPIKEYLRKILQSLDHRLTH